MILRLPPALRSLHRTKLRARFNRVLEHVGNPRRRLRTFLALLLGVLWLGNALATLMFREPYDLAGFRENVAFALLGYALWTVVKVAVSRPPTAIEWRPADRLALLTGPFSRRDVLAYRLAESVPGTLFKAACVAFFFLPEIPVPLAGLLGAFLGFHFLELLRLNVHVVSCRLPDRAYRVLRAAVIGILVAITGVAITATMAQTEIARSTLVAWSLTKTFASQTARVFVDDLGGNELMAIFSPFADVMTAEVVGPGLIRGIAFAIGLCFLAEAVLIRFFERWFDEEATFHPANRRTRRQRTSRFRRLPRLGGLGPIAWRQWNTARSHGVGVVLALAAPTALALAPLLLDLDAENTFLNVVAGAAFYSLLLLPSGLKFDFRLDYERLPVLRSLPVRPWTLAMGQILVPVGLTIVYQLAVIGIACAVRPVAPTFVLAALLILVPTTFIVYAIDNTLFLLAPHRVRQDGFEVLLKGLLTFTAKGVVFGLGVVVVLGWVEAVVALDGWLSSVGITLGRRTLFAGGIAVSTTVAAVVSVLLLGRTFARCEALPRAE